MEIKGKALFVGETQEFASGFKKRLIVIEVADGNYTNKHGVEFAKDSVSKLDGIKAGDTVEVSLNLGQCREYQGKWYADMHRGWKIKKLGSDVTETSLVADEETPF